MEFRTSIIQPYVQPLTIFHFHNRKSRNLSTWRNSQQVTSSFPAFMWLIMKIELLGSINCLLSAVKASGNIPNSIFKIQFTLHKRKFKVKVFSHAFWKTLEKSLLFITVYKKKRNTLEEIEFYSRKKVGLCKRIICTKILRTEQCVFIF